MTNSISPTGPDFNFAVAQDAADEERTPRNWSSVEELAIYYPYNDDEVAPEATDDNDFTYEDDMALELIKLDTTGIVDLNSPDNPHRDFDPLYFDWGIRIIYEVDCEIDRPAIALLDDVRIVFDDSHDYSSGNESRPLDRFMYADNDDGAMPSFSSNKGQVRPLNWWQRDDKWDRYFRNVGTRKASKRRDENGRRLHKDRRSDRDSFRSFALSWLDYYAEFEYTAEQCLADHRALAEARERETYEAEAQREREDYIRELEMAAWEANFDWDYSHVFDPVNNTGLLLNIWERHLFPERFEPVRPYLDDRDYGWDEPERDEDEDHRYADGPTLEEYEDLDRLAAKNDNEDTDPRIGNFGGLTRTNILSRQNRSVLNRQLMVG